MHPTIVWVHYLGSIVRLVIVRQNGWCPQSTHEDLSLAPSDRWWREAGSKAPQGGNTTFSHFLLGFLRWHWSQAWCLRIGRWCRCWWSWPSIVIGCYAHQTAARVAAFFVTATIGVIPALTVASSVVAQLRASAGLVDVATLGHKFGAVFGVWLHLDAALLSIAALVVEARVFTSAPLTTLRIVLTTHSEWTG